MAERKSGPVKPPVIDLVARDATEKPQESKASAPAPEAAAPPPPPPPKPNPELWRLPGDVDWRLLVGVAITGAVLGTILTYLLANLLALPSPLPKAPDLTPQLAEQQGQLDGFEIRLGGLEGAATKTQISLDATIAQLDAGLIELRKSVEDLRATIPAAPEPVDLTAIETELRALTTRVDAIAAGAGGADVGAITTSLAALESGLANLASRIDGVDGRLAAIDGTAASLRADLNAARKQLSDHISTAAPNETGPALKLPLILSGLEAAFASGKPFALELESLGTVLPDLPVSDALRATAGNGLSHPDTLNAKFEAALPDILAAQPGGAGSWTDNAINWVQGLLALRPADEIAGDTPVAIVTRLEATMARQDYGAAQVLLASLPAPMVTAAGDVAAEIGLHADAQALVVALRTTALGTTP